MKEVIYFLALKSKFSVHWERDSNLLLHPSLKVLCREYCKALCWLKEVVIWSQQSWCQDGYVIHWWKHGDNQCSLFSGLKGNFSTFRTGKCTYVLTGGWSTFPWVQFWRLTDLTTLILGRCISVRLGTNPFLLFNVIWIWVSVEYYCRKLYSVELLVICTLGFHIYTSTQ